MPHFYVKPENITDNNFLIEDEQAHYVATVRRFNVNDEIMIFDGLGNSYKAHISEISKGHISGKILSSSYKMPKLKINLYTAIPKGDRFEWLIEKAGEIGVAEIIPINTKRSVQASFSKNKLERYEKISIAASSQCGRNDIMKISEPVDFKTACANAAKDKNSLNILPWESADKNETLKNISGFTSVNIFIGPEGGFENEEAEFAKSLAIKTVTLGENILRIETAAIVASVLVLNSHE
ncbi:RsmE family RNA methyltransferase [Endomicrobium proavitum]|uniref:Ribosomal RNA small subunit methyltransferase E n=1 Tax=Endomicrobium proavitum TaxID=1408281 RepID=A0A0G3WL05_9BACT|nr:RsmE family RNA methyltransferase [Endomicrobium proavitum]AKL98184.1 putative Ribosomal RNA small subunit methyltransferase E [Endomicrobium proavitum]